MILLRSVVYNIWFYVVSVVLVLACGPFLPFPRRYSGPVVWVIGRFWARLLVGGARVICGIRVAVTGRENLPVGPVLIASNHQSAFDTIIWLLLIDRAVYVVKKELGHIPLYGGITRRLGMIIVDRDAGAAAIRHLLAGAAQAVAENRSIVIFPEGTRSHPDEVGVLHPGVAAMAAHSGLAVVPVVTDSGRHWGRRTFLRYPGTIHIAIRPALPAGMKRRDLLAALEATYRAGVG